MYQQFLRSVFFKENNSPQPVPHGNLVSRLNCRLAMPRLTAVVCLQWPCATPCKAPVTHVLQPVGDCLATEKQLQPMQPLCDQELHFSVADQSATGGRQLSLKIGDRSATGGRLIANWLEMGCDWSATRWRLVGDELATDYQTNNLLCMCNHE